MKKFTSLLLLLLTMFLWGGVDVVAQTFTVSEAPSNGQWAENTHWYTIKLKEQTNSPSFNYLSTDADCVDENGFLKFTATSASSVGAYWCVVASGDGGYKFYNYVSGPTKVLGIFDYGNGDEAGGQARAKMYNVDETTGQYTTFYSAVPGYKPEGDKLTSAFRISKDGNNYLNNRDSFLSFWNANGAVASNCSGSAFVFEDVATDGDDFKSCLEQSYDKYVGIINGFKTTYEAHAGKLFCFSQESLNGLPSVEGQKPTEVAALKDAVENLSSAIAKFKESRIMPEVGKQYALKTVQYGDDKYLYGPLTISEPKQLHGEQLTKQRNCWILESGSLSGTYRLKNAATGLYVNGESIKGASQSYKVSLTPTDFVLFPNDGNRYGTAKIGKNSQYLNLHIDGSNNLVSWESAPASSWYFEEVSEEQFASLQSENADVLSAVSVARILPVKTDAVSSNLDAYNATHSTESAEAFVKAVEASTYVRIKNVGRGKALGVSDDASYPHGKTWSLSDAGLIWKIDVVDDKGVRKMKMHHLNTSKYLGTVWNKDGAATGANMKDNLTDGATWSFTPKDSHFILRDGDNAVMNCEANGNINRWDKGVTESPNNVSWDVTVAENVQLTLNEVNGKSYATAYLPFPVRAVEGAKAYVGTFNDAHTAITLTEKAEIPANEGVVLISDDAAATATLTIGGNAVNEGTNAFTGTNTAITLSEENRGRFRVLGRKASDATGLSIGFFKPSNSVESIPANRAYVDASSTSTASSVSVNFGTVEGLGSIVTETSEDANSPIYDLSGRRVMHTVKGGLYIRNGKKFLVK